MPEEVSKKEKLQIEMVYKYIKLYFIKFCRKWKLNPIKMNPKEWTKYNRERAKKDPVKYDRIKELSQIR